jgi:hypothetical protein
MIKSIFSFLLLVGCFNVRAQFKIKEIKDSTDTGVFVFPVLQSAQQSEIVKKINRTLQVSELGLEIGPSIKDPLVNLKNEDDYGYNIICNNARVFSLEISTGHHGAGSHYQFRDYSFDATTGNTIDQNTVFSPTGQVKVKQSLYKAWKESIKANLNDKTFSEDYKTCLAEAEKISELEINRMAVAEKTVDFWGGSCLDGSAWMMDKTLGPHRVPYEQLLSMLTPYGLSLFIGSPTSTGSLQRALIKGKIDGKYEITLTFIQTNQFGSIKGIIVYDKFNSPIPISGALVGDKVMFHEMDPSNNPVSDIECTWDGKNLSGIFRNKQTGKIMGFAAEKI